MRPIDDGYSYRVKPVETSAIADRLSVLEKQVFDLACELKRADLKIKILQAEALQVHGLVKKVTE